ncbi:dihydroorotate dehydrogenase electron transfer subunit [Candidatus Saganbacteria bacterium]|nr:dihydroorotate dehydrogenase electron transfer subunit [Candidatus Saganbacteria bacterium]
MPIQEKRRILEHQQIAPQQYKLTISSPYISANAQPGQFVQVRISSEFDPLLRRPLSIHRHSIKHKSFELLYEVIGKGTELLSQASVGSELDILGPLGKSFMINQSEVAILVGGGMGSAPLLMLAETLKAGPKKKAIYVILGAKTKERIIEENIFREAANEVVIATDDGSYGQHGFVSDVLINLLENVVTPNHYSQTTIYACGPHVMLHAIADLTFQKQIACQVSMEQKMACGIGTCLGCVIKTRSGYKKVCDEGPVFDAKEIEWQV